MESDIPRNNCNVFLSMHSNTISFRFLFICMADRSNSIIFTQYHPYTVSFFICDYESLFRFLNHTLRIRKHHLKLKMNKSPANISRIQQFRSCLQYNPVFGRGKSNQYIVLLQSCPVYLLRSIIVLLAINQAYQLLPFSFPAFQRSCYRFT